MQRPIINLDTLALSPLPAAYAASGETAQRYAPRIAMVGAQLGAQKLGYNVISLAPGLRAFPFHNHRVNEELFYILAGSGEMRIGDQRHAVRAGDFICCPAGGVETAHQLINTSEAELRYLAVSTQMAPEIAEFPDSGKYSVMDGQGARIIGKLDCSLDYWEGE
ncbi:cupin domain-containing protein [Janthinobacterium sp. Mn2066]|uniref:cupin domain-containing protein n=1 Tax=Janthinobacterium sp. Mn2066 TaxID=3395264 RepID=UPI003BBA7293